MSSLCIHETLNFKSSDHAAEAGYRRPTPQQRAAATTLSTRKHNDGAQNADELESTFPAPIVLPADDLAVDPGYQPQSLLAWKRDKDRNEVTTEKNVIYVAAPPDADLDVDFVKGWSVSSMLHQQEGKEEINTPRTQDVIEYLAAFYNGLPAKIFPSTLRFTSWDEGTRKSSKARQKAKSTIPPYIGLTASNTTECIRIRTRSRADSPFAAQLNLNDLLDAAIDFLPGDAYALLLLVTHDMYEDEGDDFTCGRAYGGSRIAVVSMARYHPGLDVYQDVEREHGWPASHCHAYMQRCCDEADQPVTRGKKKFAKSSVSATTSPVAQTSALHTALSAHATFSSTESLSGLYLARVARTASHELGHCFGLDHCVYYACIMQGTAGLSEDARQPPYLCPVDLAKVLKATGCDEKLWLEGMLQACEGFGRAGETKGRLWVAFAGWLRARLREVGGVGVEDGEATDRNVEDRKRKYVYISD